MRLAEDEITVRIGKDAVMLRPSLRAALRLERQFEGFDKLVEALDGGSVVAMAAVIRESSHGQFSDIPDLIESLAGMHLHVSITSLKQPLIDHVLRLAGHDETDPAPADANAKRISFAEHRARLYRIATGWLGWTPETTWAATANEITEAYQGRVELLKSIFGSTDDEAAEPPPASPEALTEKVRSFFGGLGTRKVTA